MKKKVLSALAAALILSTASSTTSAREIDDQLTFDAETSYYFLHNGLAGRKNSNALELRLAPTVTLNDNLTLKSRLVGWWDLNDGDADFDSRLSYIYLEGDIGAYNIKAGRVQLATQADRNPVSGSMVAEDAFKGVQVSTGLELDNGADATFIVNAGKLHDPTYIGLEALYDSNENLTGGVGYHYLKKNSFKSNVFTLGAGYQVNEDWNLYGAYAHNSKANFEKNAYNIEAAYLGADSEIPDTWGAFVAYRYLGTNVLDNNENDMFNFARGLKGINVGGTWTPIENSLLKVSYMHGKRITGNDSTNIFLARASLFF